jgi:hypothetical protein
MSSAETRPRNISLLLRPLTISARQRLETAHTIVVKRGSGRVQEPNGGERFLQAGDVELLAPGGYIVENASRHEPLDVLLIAA